MNSIKVIYLAAGTANINIPGFDITYQDINGTRDIHGDMLNVDLSPYDILIATPPCNYYSRANWRREQSEYSLKTKHLLPRIIKKFEETKKPFIVENVRNPKLFNNFTSELEITTFIKIYGRHTYFTNINMDFKSKQEIEHINLLPKNSYLRQGSENVNKVIEEFLKKLS